MTTQTVQVKVTQLFNGEVAGFGEQIVEVEAPHGLASLIFTVGRLDTGWTRLYSVASVEDAEALGAYQGAFGEWFLDMPEMPVSLVQVYIDPTFIAAL